MHALLILLVVLCADNPNSPGVVSPKSEPLSKIFNLPIQENCPQFIFGGPSGDVTVTAPGPYTRKWLVDGKEYDVPPVNTDKQGIDIFKVNAVPVYVYPPVTLEGGGQFEVRVFLDQTEQGIFHKRAQFRLTNTANGKLLKEIILGAVNTVNQTVYCFPGDIQSYPAFLKDWFVGVEFPIAATRMKEKDLLLAYRPGINIAPDKWYETRAVVCGFAQSGIPGVAPSLADVMRAFRRYILSHRPPSASPHVNYNSWWTSPAPYYKEKDILDLMGCLDTNLFQAQNTHLDTFCIDMGWSNPKSLWEIDDKLFPQGFTRIQDAAEKMKCELGLWISPSSCYPTALDNGWAKEHGYEASKNSLCLGGKKYAAAFRDRLVNLVTKYKIRHIKLDGYVSECPEKDHGHEPGVYSADPIAEGLIDAAEAIHKAAPDVWLEETGFGYNPSPWWLFYFNSVIGSFGDDAPFGRVPAPVYRESYTTARDFFNLQGAFWSSTPAAGEEVLGIIHQTPESFLNDAVMTVMRGHMFLPLYVNPAYMDARRWQMLALVIDWARQNAPALEETAPLIPQAWIAGKCPKFTADAVMPRQPYGYMHMGRNKNLIVLRNPWIKPQQYTLGVDAGTGFTPDATGIKAVSLYPEPRVYGVDLKSGDVLKVPLAPYETLVLRLAPDQKTEGIPPVQEKLEGHLAVGGQRVILKKLAFDDKTPAFAPDSTSLVGDARTGGRLALESKVTVKACQAELLILIEGSEAVPEAHFHLGINNKPVTPAKSSSDTAWGASGQKRPEHWAFFSAPLAPGENTIAFELLTADPSAKASVWAWATRPGYAPRTKPPGDAAPAIAATLPEPESVSLDAAMLVEPVVVMGAAGEALHVPRPVEKINGVYLDTFKPASATQGWGTLQKNKSVWERPLVIAGRSFLRGLGTHAPSRIVYDLDGRFTRFQAMAGCDNATNPTVTFEVDVDGQKRWESGPMKREDAPKPVDVDLKGAKKLELVVGDGGNGIEGDHADWADAKLLK